VEVDTFGKPRRPAERDQMYGSPSGGLATRGVLALGLKDPRMFSIEMFAACCVCRLKLGSRMKNME
jgi:hypothetical protein